MTIFKALNSAIVDSRSLVSCDDIVSFDDSLFTGMSLIIEDEFLVGIQSYFNGKAVNSKNQIKLCELIPYSIIEESDQIVDFEIFCLDDLSYDVVVRLSGEPFTGVTLEFRDGYLETVCRYVEGKLVLLFSWSKTRELIGFYINNGHLWFEYQKSIGSNDIKLDLSCGRVRFSLSSNKKHGRSSIASYGKLADVEEVVDEALSPFNLSLREVVVDFLFENSVSIVKEVDLTLLQLLRHNFSINDSKSITLKELSVDMSFEELLNYAAR